jgi:formate dehydrogenase iron-sulfur subunit
MKLRVNRRNFLGSMLTAAASALVTHAPKKVSAHDFAGYETSKGVLVDLGRCVGCRSCEAACNKEQGLPEPEIGFDDLSIFDQTNEDGKRRPDENAYTVVNQYDSPLLNHPLFRKIQCNHCLEPACLTACFVNAYTKTPEGAVIYDPDVCVGCRTCMIACPFSIPAFRYTSAFDPRIMKCIFCYDSRLSKDLPPACVEACPMEALTFGDRKTLLRIARKRMRENPERYVQHIYGEFEAGGTSWLYLSPVPFEHAGFDIHVPKQPIINYVKDFLAIVPMVLTIWPGLFAGFFLLSRRTANAKLQTPPPEESNDENSGR